jgi:pimeloyl-ACP methyl ester carboxylesterase
MLVGKLDLVHKLPDGRRLGYCEYGDADGLAIVALHGTPGSRYKFGLADQEARRLGLRLISPDRWGYGLSDAPSGVSGLGEYAADIADLAQALNLSRFGVVGISGGGPYAVALASQMPERVDALALVAPVAPVSKAEERDGVSLFHRFAFRGLPRVPGAVSLAFLYFRGVLAVSPWWAARTMAARAGRPDRILLADPEIRNDLTRTFRAGLQSGVRGAAMDMGYFSRSWPLDFAAINMPGRMWLGGQDRNVPLPAARKLAERIELLDIVENADAGHFWVTKNFPQVLEWLRETMREQAGVQSRATS